MKHKNTNNNEIENTKLFNLIRGYNQVRIENSIDKIHVYDYEDNSCGLCYYYYTVIDNYQILIIESKVDNVDFICNFKLFVDRVFNVLNISHFESIRIFALHKQTFCQFSHNQQINLTSVSYETSLKLKEIINNLSKDKNFYINNTISYLHKMRKRNSRELRLI
jgi:hypothetical protein